MAVRNTMILSSKAFFVGNTLLNVSPLLSFIDPTLGMDATILGVIIDGIAVVLFFSP